MGNIPSIQAGTAVSEQKQQKAALLDTELQNAGFSESKIDQMLSDANDIIGCGPECQRQRRINELQRDVNEAKSHITNAPSDLRRAEQALITFQNGSAAYTDEMRQRYSVEAKDMVLEKKISFQKNLRNTNTLIDELETSEVYVDNAKELLDVKLNKKNTIEKDIDTNTGIVRTNNRRGEYKDEQITFYQRILTWFRILYYILLVVMIIRIYMKGALSNKSQWLLIAMFATIPFILSPLYNFLVLIITGVKQLF
jgi:hypothetical protein